MAVPPEDLYCNLGEQLSIVEKPVVYGLALKVRTSPGEGRSILEHHLTSCGE